MSSPAAGKSAIMLAGNGNSSPLKEGRKRAVEDEVDGSPAVKKTCVDEDAISRSQSPDTSSLFDLSGDMSWATSMSTEPDATTTTASIAPITRPRSLTREQAREKAEILRLRLGLASYKLRTGQTSIPLSQLQPKPLPRRPNTHVRSQSLNSIRLHNSNTPSQQQQKQQQKEQLLLLHQSSQESADLLLLPTGDTTEEAESSSQSDSTPASASAPAPIASASAQALEPADRASARDAAAAAAAVITGLQPSLLPDSRIATAGKAAAVAALSLSMGQ
ncbi:hypothetical protein PT974_08202 [Cladobotryum mycophilum]|uniref:Cyclin-dependent kinase n=1 Tax=Cladobotryum mycophilum TaxID=491253 RepID=A0ABR0SCQ7_9HYPO